MLHAVATAVKKSDGDAGLPRRLCPLAMTVWARAACRPWRPATPAEWDAWTLSLEGWPQALAEASFSDHKLSVWPCFQDC